MHGGYIVLHQCMRMCVYSGGTSDVYKLIMYIFTNFIYAECVQSVCNVKVRLVHTYVCKM